MYVYVFLTPFLSLASISASAATTALFMRFVKAINEANARRQTIMTTKNPQHSRNALEHADTGSPGRGWLRCGGHCRRRARTAWPAWSERRRRPWAHWWDGGTQGNDTPINSTHTHTHTHASAHTHAHTHIHQTHTHTYTHKQKHTHIHIHIHTQTHTHTHRNTLAHIRAHARIQLQPTC
jgi:hypothetical protein